MPGCILLVEDDMKARLFLSTSLKREGYAVREAESAREALEQLQGHPIDLVILDLGLPDRSGMELLPEITANYPNLPAIVLTASREPSDAVMAMKLHACDFLVKPPDLTVLKQTIAHLLNTSRLRDQIELLRASQSDATQPMVFGKSRAMMKVLEEVEHVAPQNTRVLLLGESGTGKERIANLIHSRSPRARRPFVAVNTSAIPEQLVESEFFGFMKAAHSTAKADRKGLFEHADGGTLFLDEISSMRHDLQAKLLRVIEDSKVRRLGSSSDIEVDVRIVSASNSNLLAMSREGAFREDLYYRLSGMIIRLPPLRERSEDIPELVAAYIDHFNRAAGSFVEGVSPEALSCLQAYPWPGNIRELRNAIERSVILAKEGEIGLEHLPQEVLKISPDALTPKPASGDGSDELKYSLPELEKQLIRDALARTNGDRAAAAAALGLTVEDLERRLGPEG